MPYKDKDKQRQAVMQATRRYRQGITGKVSQGITEKVSPTVSRVSHSPGITQGITEPADATAQTAQATATVKTQSIYPMMVGYVPSKE